MMHHRYAFMLSMILMLWTSSAYAHKITVFAWVEGKTIHTESKFSGGKMVKNGRIEVYDHRNQKVLEGKTDDKGYFAFPLPPNAQTLNIRLSAGMGHSNHWQITAQELGGKTMENQKHTNAQSPPIHDNHHIEIDTDTLEAIVERAVEKKTAPLKAQLAEQAWGLRDIVAGIGYILGLMGLASYIHYRKSIPQNANKKQSTP